MPTKRLILPVSISEENFNDFDHAIIDLTDREIQRIQQMNAAVIAAKVDITDVIYKLVAFDHGVTVMVTDYDTDYLDNGRAPLKLPDPNDGRITGICLNVTDDDFYYSFHPKHSSTYCETSSVSLYELVNFDTVDAREVSDDIN